MASHIKRMYCLDVLGHRFLLSTRWIRYIIALIFVIVLNLRHSNFFIILTISKTITPKKPLKKLLFLTKCLLQSIFIVSF